MDSPSSLFTSLRAAWRAALPGAFERGIALAVVYLVALYLVVLAIERASGTRGGEYRTRGFLHDIAYYFYYRSGAHRFLVTAGFFAALDAPLSFLDLRVLASLPLAAQVALGLVVSDFTMYWLHRAQHRFRFLWAFHSTHHSQENLTFTTYLRFHPVEVFTGECVAYVIMRVLGLDLGTWFAVFFVTNFLGEIQHTRIPWKMGPLYRVIVTPTFHSYHHSPEIAVHDRNYGGLFSCWDYLFGTAVADGTPQPARHGLSDVKPDSLWSTLVTPFHLLRAFYFRRAVNGGASASPSAAQYETVRQVTKRT